MAIQTNKDVTEITYNGVNVPLYHKTQTKSTTITSNGTTTISKDADYDGMTSVEITTNVEPMLELVDRTVTRNGEILITKSSSAYDGIDFVDLIVNVPQTTVEPLSVTENGTYTAPSGTAYSPVTVNVSGGGGEPVDATKQVLFIDYDGTPLHSYTYDESMALTSLPANPSHAGLTAQGWNWTLADIQAYLTTYPNAELVIGQHYVTTDGKTKLYVDIPIDNVSFSGRLYINGTVAIDWGDGTATTTLTGTSITSSKSTNHTYSSKGSYVISIDCTSGAFTISNRFSTHKYFLGGLRKVEYGSNVYSLGATAFNNVTNLETISVPSSFTDSALPANYASGCKALRAFIVPRTITSCANAFGNSNCLYVSMPYSCTVSGNAMFNGDYMLQRTNMPTDATSTGTNYLSNTGITSIVIPSGTTAINSGFVNSCTKLLAVEIPASVTSIAASAFSGTTNMWSLKFKSSTPPTVANSNAWSNMGTQCTIYVPSGSLSAYTSAANYPSSSTYAYVEY